jgi:DNA-binding transcriptional LysR family regulator
MSKPRLDYLKDRHLKLLVCLSEEKQLGRAAARLGISQPAASKTLVDIEDRVGCALFLRGPHETIPTQHGDILVGYARHCLGETRRVAEELEALSRRQTKMLRIGMLGSSAMTVVPKLVEELARADPLIEVSLEENILPQLVEKLRSSEIDLFVGRIDTAVPHEEFEELFLYDEPLVIVCRRGHPILQNVDLKLADTLHFPWILPLRTTLMRRKVDDLFRTLSLMTPRHVVESNSIIANVALLQNSDRVCAMSQGAAQRWIDTALLERLPIDVGVYPGSIGAVFRRNEVHLEAVKMFIDVLRSMFPANN